MNRILEGAASALVPLLCVMIFVSGTYFAAALRMYPFRRPGRLARVFFPGGRGWKESLSSFRAMTLALAGTLGVGNIVGVASALVQGGRGAIFWMWISALFATVVKYAEIVAAVRTRKCRTLPGRGKVYHGGAMYYIKSGAVSSLFAALIIFGSFFIGNIIQVKAASEAVGAVFGVPQIYTSSLLALICCAVLIGGGKRVSGFTSVLIPTLALCYIGASLYIIISDISLLPSALSSILHDAFSPVSVGIGGAGCTVWMAMRYGITRGLFSSEAGCGSAPIAHAEAHCHSPAEQGCYGIFEVTADTGLLCTLSALVILLSPDAGVASQSYDGTGIELVINAFSSRFGSTAGLFISLSVALFALATLVCWAHYGTEAIAYLRGKRKSRADKTGGEPPRFPSACSVTGVGRGRGLPAADAVYILVYCTAAALSAKISGEAVWSLADLSLAAMTVINLPALFPERKLIAAETFRIFARRRYKKLSSISEPMKNGERTRAGSV